jgi:hypothetical protein
MLVADEMNDAGSVCSRTFPNMERKRPSCSAALLQGIGRKLCYPDSALVSNRGLHADYEATAVKLKNEPCSATTRQATADKSDGPDSGHHQHGDE